MNWQIGKARCRSDEYAMLAALQHFVKLQEEGRV